MAAARTQCGSLPKKTANRYEYIPASMKVIQDVCLKYACDCNGKDCHQAAATD